MNWSIVGGRKFVIAVLALAAIYHLALQRIEISTNFMWCLTAILGFFSGFNVYQKVKRPNAPTPAIDFSHDDGTAAG